MRIATYCSELLGMLGGESKLIIATEVSYHHTVFYGGIFFSLSIITDNQTRRSKLYLTAEVVKERRIFLSSVGIKELLFNFVLFEHSNMGASNS